MEKGLLLVNLGTPKDTTPASVRTYLRKFLSDRRVIKTHPVIWRPILEGMILPSRPKKSALLYQELEKKAGLPLLRYMEEQGENLRHVLPDYEVCIAMSYSEPFIEESLQSLLDKGVTKLTVVPCYPQYSGTTVGSVFDDVMKFFLKSDKVVDINFIHSFCEDPLYIKYYVEKIKAALEKEKVDAICFSYHGIPVSYVTEGDKYPEECQKTTAAIMKEVGDVPYYQTYQSKFGPSEWLTPATDATMKELPQKGVKKILMIAPGFTMDCLETVIELEEENKGYFMENGGEKFIYVPPFNGDIEFAELVKSLL